MRRIKMINYNRTVAYNYIVLLIFWMFYTAALITTLIFFIRELNNINNTIVPQYGKTINELLKEINDGTINATTSPTAAAVYQTLLAIKYPLIDFSLLSFNFFNGASGAVTDYAAAWTTRTTNINLAYSYIFITAMIAAIALIYYVVIIGKLFWRTHFEKKYQLSTKYHNDYVIFDTRIFLNFIVALAVIFSFFNFLTTLISLGYGIFIVLVSYFAWYILHQRTEILVPHKWWKATNFSFFVIVLLIQNIYTFGKAFFSAEFGVNLDLILSIIIPIGTISVIIAVFIKNMLSTKVTSVRNAVKTIAAKMSSFRIFLYTQELKSLEDYTFVTQLPLLVKKPLQNNSVKPQTALALMYEIDEAGKFFEQHYIKVKQLNYMLYHLYNEITQLEEIQEIKNNCLKLEQLRPNKTKR